MSLDIDMFIPDEVKLLESKKDEFYTRLEKVFYHGGMMKAKKNELYGITFYTLHRALMDEEGIEANYNIFDGEFWPLAGFKKDKESFFSRGMFLSSYGRVLRAAYVLNQRYLDGVSGVIWNGKFQSGKSSIAWLNYIFNEKKYLYNLDSWKLYEAIHYYDEKCLRENGNGYHYSIIDKDNLIEQFYFDKFGYAFIGLCEIYAVEFSTEEALERIKEIEEFFSGFDVHMDMNKDIYQCMQSLFKRLRLFAKKCTDLGIDKDKQFSIIIEILLISYSIDIMEYEDRDILYKILRELWVANAPAFFVKAICEVYDRDFWVVWDSIKDKVYRRYNALNSTEMMYLIPISTWDFLEISKDDYIMNIEEKYEDELSNKTYKLFDELKVRYNEIINSKDIKKLSLKDIVTLLDLANENYCNIFVRQEFYEETVENLSDVRYQALWLIFEEMITNQKMFDWGRAVFVKDSNKYSITSVDDLKNVPTRKLKGGFCRMAMDDYGRDNKARVILRRYMALVANKKLRKEVFGF